ncbi:MAG: MFS transporter [Methanoregula sp.]|nr:MFS transporter [Methanoregula sp.]
MSPATHRTLPEGQAAVGTDQIFPAICHIPDKPVTPAGKQIVLLIAVLSGFITPFDGSAVTIALSSMGAEFHMDAIALSWIVTAYVLAAALVLVPIGKVADIYGRKRIFLYGIAAFAAASFAMTLVPTAPLLIAVRFLQGCAGAMIFGTSLAILTTVFPPGERGRAIGIYITAVYFGLTIGPFLGGALTQYFGWRSIFLVNVPLGIVCCLLIIGKLEGEWAECEGERFDLTGSLIYAAALVAVICGFSIMPDPAGIYLIVAGCLIGVVFFLYEARVPVPVLDIRLFTKNREFASLNLAAFFNYSAVYAVMFLMSLDLQYTKGFSPAQAGLILLTQPAAMAVVSLGAGWLSDRIDPRTVAAAGMGVTGLGIFLLALVNETSTIPYIAASLVAVGIGLGLFTSPNAKATMGAVEKRYYGVASGLTNAVRMVSQMISMGIVMMVFSLVIGRVEITPAVYPQFVLSLHVAFVLFAILCVIGIAVSLVKGKEEPAQDGMD